MKMDKNMDLPCSIQTGTLRNQHIPVIWRHGLLSEHSCAKLYQGHHDIAVSPFVWGSFFQLVSVCVTPGELRCPEEAATAQASLLSLHSFHLHWQLFSCALPSDFWAKICQRARMGLGVKRPVWGDITGSIMLHQGYYITPVMWL